MRINFVNIKSFCNFASSIPQTTFALLMVAIFVSAQEAPKNESLGYHFPLGCYRYDAIVCGKTGGDSLFYLSFFNQSMPQTVKNAQSGKNSTHTARTRTKRATILRRTYYQGHADLVCKANSGQAIVFNGIYCAENHDIAMRSMIIELSNYFPQYRLDLQTISVFQRYLPIA